MRARVGPTPRMCFPVGRDRRGDGCGSSRPRRCASQSAPQAERLGSSAQHRIGDRFCRPGSTDGERSWSTRGVNAPLLSRKHTSRSPGLGPSFPTSTCRPASTHGRTRGDDHLRRPSLQPRNRAPDTRKRPKELVGGPACRLAPAPNKSGVTALRSETLTHWSYDQRARFPVPSRGSLPGAVWRFAPAPSGKTKCTGRPASATTALSTNST
jgi:hypothetical protein